MRPCFAGCACGGADAPAVPVGTIRSVRRRDYVGPVMCALGAACLLAALTVDLQSTAAKALMAAAGVLFVPGAYVTLALVRRIAGPPN